MALTVEQEKALAEFADVLLKHGVADVSAAVEIAKDEAMRVAVNKHFWAAAADMSLENRAACVEARAILRKMYEHHGAGQVWAPTLSQIAEASAADLRGWYAGVADPAPDSESFRTPGT